MPRFNEVRWTHGLCSTNDSYWCTHGEPFKVMSRKIATMERVKNVRGGLESNGQTHWNNNRSMGGEEGSDSVVLKALFMSTYIQGFLCLRSVKLSIWSEESLESR